MADFYTLLTNAGIAYENACKAAGLPIKLSQISVGDGNGAVYNPAATATALKREVWRGPLNALFQDEQNPSWLLAEVTIPPEEGGFYVREAGIWTDSGILYAIVKYPESFKPVLASSGSGKEFYIRSIFETSNASSVTLLIDDTVVKATRAWVMGYLADELAKLDGKQSVRVATTENIVLNGAQQIDGIAVVSGQRVLVTAQTAAKDNGIYVVANGPWVRSADSNTSAKVTPGLTVMIEEGTKNGDSLWHLVTNGPITLGTTALFFEMLAGRTGVEPGTYKSVWVDKYGRVLGGTNPTTLAGFGIEDVYTKLQAEKLVRDAIAVPVVSVSASYSLPAAELGLVMIDSALAAVTVTLPASNGALGVRDVVLRRTDATANVLVIAAAGTDKILLDTTAQAAGQATTELLFSGDFLRLRSDGAGKWWCIGQSELPGSIATGYNVISATGVSAYAVPPVLRSGRRWAKVKITGGGGGGACKASAPGPSGGAAGGVAEKRINLAGVTTVSVTVGPGGAAGATDGAFGAVGGASTFGAYCSAQGGGAGQVNGNAPVGGVGVGGDLNYSLGSGCPAVSGPGGSLFGGYGGGAASPIASSDSTTPARPGCGGAGRTTSAGVAGANGLAEVSW
ncbi:phage tail protein [Pseudomonas sp. RT6P73]